jgi:hypothetical protein
MMDTAASVADGAAVGRALVDAHGAVAWDVPCQGCGYNLRGLPAAGQCPECGAPAAASLRGNLLQFSRPEWIRQLSRGARLSMWGAGLTLLTAVVGIPVLIFTRRARGLFQLVMIVGRVVGWTGGWLLTEPDPSGKGEDEYGTSRKVIRWCLGLEVGRQVLSLVRNFAPPPIVLLNPLQLAMDVCMVAGVVGWIAELNYLQKLARRLPDAWIERRARFLKQAIGVTDALNAALSIAATWVRILGRGRMTGAAMPLACSALLGTGVITCLTVVYLLMLDRLRERLNAAAYAADKNLADATAAGAGGTFAPATT